VVQQVKAQNYMNDDLISVGKSMTFYLLCHFASGLMSLRSPVDAFQPQGQRMNSQKSLPKLLSLPRFHKDCWAVARCMCDQMSILQTKGYQDFFSPSSLDFSTPLFPHFIIPANHWGRRTKFLLKDGKLWCLCAFSTKWTKFNFAKIQTNTGNFCGSFL